MRTALTLELTLLPCWGTIRPSSPLYVLWGFSVSPVYTNSLAWVKAGCHPLLGDLVMSSVHVLVNARAPTALSTCYCYIFLWVLLHLKSSSFSLCIYLAQEIARLGISSLYCSLEIALTVSGGNHRPHFTSLCFFREELPTVYCCRTIISYILSVLCVV